MHEINLELRWKARGYSDTFLNEHTIFIMIKLYRGCRYVRVHDSTGTDEHIYAFAPKYI